MASKSPYIKIGIVGPESCGKTTLALDLAQALGYTLIPEYSRLYFIQKQNNTYDINDIINIAKEQLGLEQNHPHQHLICDTHLLVCKIWAEVRFGYCPSWIIEHYHPHDYTFHFLTAPDIPWEPDPLRENAHDREKLFSLYEADLRKTEAPYAVISGTRPHRLTFALDILATDPRFTA